MDKSFALALADEAKRLGAQDAIPFELSDIAFDSRTILKCLYGCGGGLHYCPTSPGEASGTLLFQELVRKYKWGVLIRTEEISKGQDITLALESKAFLAGYYFAFGASECATCSTCTAETGDPCVDRRRLRPPLYALGIDVYKTVRGLGWKLDVVQKKGDPVSNITAVFVE